MMWICGGAWTRRQLASPFGFLTGAGPHDEPSTNEWLLLMHPFARTCVTPGITTRHSRSPSVNTGVVARPLKLLTPQ